jgi:hypothetical protein
MNYLKYPIHHLIIQNGRIFHDEGALVSPFMDTPPINVVAREGEPEQLTAREWRFSLRLNASPDEEWKDFFFPTQVRNVQVEIARDLLHFVASPKNLKSRYETVKKAIAATNALYSLEYQSLIRQIQEKDKQEAAAVGQYQQMKQQISILFADLDL